MSANKYKKVLVTGADGFIGSHLVEHLVERGFSVKAFVFYNSFNSWGWLDQSPKHILDHVEVFSGDVRDGGCVATAMKGCDAVLHLAALIAIPFSYYAPETYIQTNIIGTMNVLQAARDLGLARVIHTSTSEVYGTARFVPISEKHPLQGQSPYSASKIGADQMALAYHASYGLPVVTIRPFNTYGPRQSARAVIPSIITQIAAGSPVVKLGALHPTRDFNFIKDTVRGFEAALLSSAGVGDVINIGSGFEVSIGDTLKLISEIMGSETHLQSDEQRLRPEKSEVERLLADNTKAKELLGWQPEFAGISGFREGLKKTIDWFINPENLSRYKTGSYNI